MGLNQMNFGREYGSGLSLLLSETDNEMYEGVSRCGMPVESQGFCFARFEGKSSFEKMRPCMA
jgi:hypothetical protein